MKKNFLLPPPFPGKMLSIGREPHYKILGLRKGYLFPGNFVGASKFKSIQKASLPGIWEAGLDAVNIYHDPTQIVSVTWCYKCLQSKLHFPRTNCSSSSLLPFFFLPWTNRRSWPNCVLKHSVFLFQPFRIEEGQSVLHFSVFETSSTNMFAERILFRKLNLLVFLMKKSSYYLCSEGVCKPLQLL